VTRGVAFREAHRLVGEAVGFALANKKELHELTLEELQNFSGLIQEDIFSYLAIRQIIERRTSYGGTAGKNVRRAIAKAEKFLDRSKYSLPNF
jgi:argininosuccinate lyase